MNRIDSLRRRPMAGFLVAIALAAIACGGAFAQEAPGVAPVAPVAVAPAAPSGEQTPAPVVPVAAQPVARREEVEVRPAPTLAERIKARLGLGGAPADLQAQLRVALEERDTLRGQLNAALGERDQVRGERDRLTAELREASAALDTQTQVVRATATEIATQVGQPLASLPAPGAEEGATQDPVAEWKAAHKAGDKVKARGLYAKHKAAIWAAKHND